MINNKIFLPFILSTFLFSATAYANPYFIFYNDNQQMFGNWDTLQFKVENSADGYYTVSNQITAELNKNFISVQIPSVHTKNPLHIYIHDVTRNTPYQECYLQQPFLPSDGLIATIYGSSNGTEFKCILK